ncbi:Glutamyl-tRNA reductase-binding protein, chloroplastic [Glycine max]|nr:Glutamyl-tRNA reductase-binding protein, chloroplastic [Glycine max]
MHKCSLKRTKTKCRLAMQEKRHITVGVKVKKCFFKRGNLAQRVHGSHSHPQPKEITQSNCCPKCSVSQLELKSESESKAKRLTLNMALPCSASVPLTTLTSPLLFMFSLNNLDCALLSPKRLVSVWRKRFGEEVDQDFIYIIAVDRILQLEDIQEITKSIWVTSSDYKNAQPDPLRDSAHNFVTEINTNNMEDITRFCNVYVDLDFLVLTVSQIYRISTMYWDDKYGTQIFQQLLIFIGNYEHTQIVFSGNDYECTQGNLLRRECCTFSNGEYVKSGVAELEKWIVNATEEYAGTSWHELNYIRQAIGFLVIHQKRNKSLEEIRLDLCPV